MRFEGLPSFGVWTEAIHGAVFTGMALMGLACGLHIAAMIILVVMRYRARKRGCVVD